MPITPTSTKSKQYQALGIDEIANDIETVFTAVNDLETEVNNLPAAPTTITVNISSAQILNMGSTPIELLPAPAAGSYYSGVSIILELDFVSTAYTFSLPIYASMGAGVYSTIKPQFITSSEDAFTELNSWVSDNYDDAGTLYPVSGFNFKSATNSITLNTWDGSSPTLGNGTLRAIITYTIRTFGA